MNILMVCMGNICRSPLAQGIMERKVARRSLNWFIDSAGISSFHKGFPPDPRAVAVAQKYSINIKAQQARPLRENDLDRFDLIFVMDRNNLRDALSYAKTEEHRNKIHLIMSWLHEENPANVPDPYFNDETFEEVFLMLEEACEAIIRKLQPSQPPVS